MEVKVKKLHPNAVIPTYAKEGDAGLDLVATSRSTDEYGNLVYGTGLSIAIPKGYVGLVFPRSSNSKTTLALTNSVGVIDSGYRGEIILKYKGFYTACFDIKWWFLNKVLKRKNSRAANIDIFLTNEYNVGDRVGQLIIVKHPYVTLVEAEELSKTDRGEDGFGSTGK